MIPGSNLLEQALSIIAPQTVSYQKFLSRSVNEIGLDVSVFAEPIEIMGSLQSVPRNLYEQYGLDLSKDYSMFYSTSNIVSTEREVQGDKITAYGNTYQCESNNDWYSVDGWKGVLLVKIPG